MSAPATTAAVRSRHDGRGWRSLVAVFAVTQTLGYGSLIQSFAVLLVPMAETLDASRTELTTAAAISTLVGAVAALPVGALLDRYGGRALMTTGSGIGVAAVVIWSQAQHLGHLYLAFALGGLALAMSTYEAAFAVLVVAADERDRDRAIIALTMVTGLATSFYYVLVGWLDAHLGWRGALLVLAASLALIAVPAHLCAVPDRAAHGLRVSERGGIPARTALRERAFWLLVVAFVAQSGATAAFLTMMVSWFRDAGHSATTAALLPIALGVLQITSRLALAPLSRRFGMTRVTTAGFAVQGVGLLALLGAGSSVPVALACIACFGFGHGIGVVARPSIVADAFGVLGFASILALMTVPVALSRAGAPIAAAAVGDTVFYLVGGVATLVAAAALLPLCRTAPDRVHH